MSSDDDTDETLIERYRAGDARAINRLLERHQPSLRRLVRRYARDEDDALDITQKVLARAFAKLDKFEGRSSFRTWLYRLAVNVAIRHRQQMPLEDWAPLDDLAALTSALETARLVAAELWRKVSALLDELPPKQRIVFELRLFHELSFEEAAIVADCSTESAKVSFHHAMKRMRARLPPIG